MQKSPKLPISFIYFVICIFALSVTSVSASAITDSIDQSNNYVSSSVLDGFVTWVAEVYVSITNAGLSLLIGNFGPDTILFDNILGSAAYKDFPYVGTVMMFTIYVIMMVFCAFGAIQLSEIKDTPWTLTGRFLIGLVLMYYSTNIVQLFFDGGSIIYNKIWNTSSDDVNVMLMALSFPVSIADSLVTAAEVTYNLVSSNVTSLIIAFVLGIVFLVQCFKFFLEIIERYVVSCFLYYIFPLPLSTIVAKNTSGILRKYMQMFIVQIIMLWMNAFFMRIIVNMPIHLTDAILGTGSNGIFMFYLFLFSFMKIARKIDSYAYTMGMSVAITGGNLMDSCRGAGLGIIYMANSLSNGGRAAGNAVTSLGAQMGNSSLMNAGMKLSGLVSAGLGRGVDSSMSGTLKEASMRGVTDSIAKSITPEQIDQSMVNAARVGDIRVNNGLNSLNDDTKAALVGKAFGPDACPRGSSMSNIHFDTHGGFSADFTNSKGIKNTMSISPNAKQGTVKSFMGPDNKRYYITKYRIN